MIALQNRTQWIDNTGSYQGGGSEGGGKLVEYRLENPKRRGPESLDVYLLSRELYLLWSNMLYFTLSTGTKVCIIIDKNAQNGSSNYQNSINGRTTHNAAQKYQKMTC